MQVKLYFFVCKKLNYASLFAKFNLHTTINLNEIQDLMTTLDYIRASPLASNMIEEFRRWIKENAIFPKAFID